MAQKPQNLTHATLPVPSHPTLSIAALSLCQPVNAYNILRSLSAHTENPHRFFRVPATQVASNMKLTFKVRGSARSFESTGLLLTPCIGPEATEIRHRSTAFRDCIGSPPVMSGIRISKLTVGRYPDLRCQGQNRSREGLGASSAKAHLFWCAVSRIDTGLTGSVKEEAN